MTVTATNPFGPIFVASDLDQAVQDTLQRWMPTYLAELERRTDRDEGDVPQVRRWASSNDFQQPYPAEQTPTVLVITTGTLDQPVKRGQIFESWWGVGVGVIVTARDQEASNRLAKLYGAAVMAILVHKASLGGLASGVDLLDVTFDDAPADFLPVGATAQVTLGFLIEGIVASGHGPGTPDKHPAGLGEVEEVDIDALVGNSTIPIPLVARSTP